MSKITIVDKNDNVIGAKERKDISKTADIYRVASLWLENSKGEVLLAQRGFDKTHDPGKWGPAVAGTVEEGESYEENIKREVLEELGIEITKLEKGPHYLAHSSWTHFSQTFIANVNLSESDFKIQEEEVEQVKWFSKDELDKLIKEKPENFIPFFDLYLKRIKDFKKGAK